MTIECGGFRDWSGVVTKKETRELKMERLLGQSGLGCRVIRNANAGTKVVCNELVQLSYVQPQGSRVPTYTQTGTPLHRAASKLQNFNSSNVTADTHHVHRLWHMREEVSDSPPLLDVVLGVGLQCMDHVWELDTITDEEHRHIVADKIPVALTGVELHSKTTRVTQGFW